MSYFHESDGYGGDEYWDNSYDEFYDFGDYNDYFDDEDGYWYDAEEEQDHQEYGNEQGHFGEIEQGLHAGNQGHHIEDFDDPHEQYHMSPQHHTDGYYPLDNGMSHHDGYNPEDEMYGSSYVEPYHEDMSQQW